ncbi:hypothetical protein [Ruegeria sp. AU67]|uniref:hypothetical protein n=1 Tax=Ruegeria sp. AU67 TaxID=2108530 RepID=UPI000D68CFEE|nr:hypothetical protein [Ruegeria sp. AU67]
MKNRAIGLFAEPIGIACCKAAHIRVEALHSNGRKRSAIALNCDGLTLRASLLHHKHFHRPETQPFEDTSFDGCTTMRKPRRFQQAAAP